MSAIPDNIIHQAINAVEKKSLIFGCDFEWFCTGNAYKNRFVLVYLMNSPAMLKKLIKKVINLTPLPVWFAFDTDLVSLKRKISFCLSLSPSQKKDFSAEKAFLKSDADVSFHWSFIFPYPFVLDYVDKTVEVHQDHDNGLFYVIHNDRRLYYSRKYLTENAVKQAYSGILLEQDEKSPHCYTNDRFNVEENDIVIDIGAAEGNFSLDVIEKAGYVYIIEPDSDWIEALNATFRPWKEKVGIINKYASDTDDTECISLGTLLGNNHVNFIKMDVGGAESRIINSSEKILRSNDSVKLAVCTYHRKKDAATTEKILRDFGFRCSFTDGYMLYIYNNLTYPFFRKTLIRARKD